MEFENVHVGGGEDAFRRTRPNRLQGKNPGLGTLFNVRTRPMSKFLNIVTGYSVDEPA
jgi:hypothetical protein